MRKILSPSIFISLFGTLFLISPIAVVANSGDPNGIRNFPEPGWSLWQPKAEIQKAAIDSGFSNMELGGYLDFENACNTDAGADKDKIEYWFRLSNSIDRIGTGVLETACWFQGRFLHTSSSTAIKSSLKNVSCLRVNSATEKSLVIRAEPKLNSRRVGVVANGKTVKLESFPADIVTADNQNWLAIISPVKGWVSDGSFPTQGNLRLCRR